MLATSSVSLRCANLRTDFRNAGRRSQQGAAILMAILTVALVAALASAIIAEHGAAIEQLGGRADQAQARWLARGAIDWARNVLEYRQQYAPFDARAGQWTTPVPPMPIDEGELSGGIEEVSSRFNINSLVSNGVVNASQQAVFLRLLVNLGLPQNAANLLSDSIIDWIDRDEAPRPNGAETSWYTSHDKVILPPQTPLLSINELMAVRGMTKELMVGLRRQIAAFPSSGNDPINPNFATAEVLAAYIDGLSLSSASQLARGPNDAPYKTVTEFTARLNALQPVSGGYNAAQFDVRSHYFLVTGRAHWGDATTSMEVLLHSDQGRPDIINETISPLYQSSSDS
jgi:general secretion pathway protein K